MLSDLRFGMVLCGARGWTQWSLRIPSSSGYSVIIWKMGVDTLMWGHAWRGTEHVMMLLGA